MKVMTDYVGAVDATLLMRLYAIELGKDVEQIPVPGLVDIVTDKRIHTRDMANRFTKVTKEYLEERMKGLENVGLVYGTPGQPNLGIPSVYRNRRLTELGKTVASILVKTNDEINSLLKT